MSKEYPGYICSTCAKKNGGKWPEGRIATFHNGTCGWCKEKAGVCGARNWGYPKYEGINEDNL